MNRSAAFTLFLSVLLAGCAATPPGPLSSLTYRCNDCGMQRNLLVLLRGLGGGNAIFDQEGIIDEIRQRQLPFDVVAPDTHFGYYRSKTLETRLKEDVIDVARRQGYKQIWLAGFSIGGFGALLYLRRYPEDVDGVLLVSPFLGRASIHNEITAAGGLAAWSTSADGPDDWERMFWHWIKNHDPATDPPIWLGYGENDRVTGAGPRILATVLPAERVFTVPGKHDIATMKAIFLRQLDMLAAEPYFLPATATRQQGPP